MNRRDFLKGLAITTTSILLPNEFGLFEEAQAAQFDNAFWNLPRRLYLKRAQTGEVLDLYYHSNGKIDDAAYRKVCWLLRDTRENAGVFMDTKLLDLMCAVQAYIKVLNNGVLLPLTINSGYRTLKTNNKLEGAAKNSMHLYGKAVDFVVPGVSIKTMGEIAKYYQGGGVGFYYGNGFVHMDTGKIRTWKK